MRTEFVHLRDASHWLDCWPLRCQMIRIGHRHHRRDLLLDKRYWLWWRRLRLSQRLVLSAVPQTLVKAFIELFVKLEDKVGEN